MACGLLLWSAYSFATKLEPTIYYQTDPAHQLQLTDLIEQGEWQRLPLGSEVSFGYTTDTYWFKSRIPAANEDRILSLGYPLLDSVGIFFVRNGEVIETYHVGDKQPFDERPVEHKNFIVPLPDRQAAEVYLQVRTESSMRFPLEIWQPLAFMQEQQYLVAATAMYFGLLYCMAIYNLFSFGVTRDPAFLKYSAYIVSIGLLVAGLDGTGYQYVWSEWPWLQDRIVTMIGSLVFLFASMVAAQVLQTKTRSPGLHKGLVTLQFIYGVIFILSMILSYAVLIPFVLTLAVFGCFYLMLTGAVLWRRGLTYARIYTLALGSLLFAVICNALGYLGLFESVFVQRYAIMIASAIEIMLLSLVLAIRFNEDRRERLVAEQQLNTQLEAMVGQRTAELEAVMGKLREANSELEQKSNEDRLTGLFNRGFLDEELPLEIRRAQRNKQSMAVLMMDIDHFKPINDEYGHLVGDEILIQLSDLLKDTCKRAGDRIFRYGGEEFVILMPVTDEAGAQEIAERLTMTIREHVFSTDHGMMQITASIGIAVYHPSVYEVSESELLAVADDALYRAKHAGRDTVRAARVANPNSKYTESF
ncbi:sensor domain-containing diguanylate cyclase [Pseudidiomarina salinarum]|uniref:sensor domain-containing diguanylate cyclase n=1 Tax=Pseudidiomarina salinarum TaxID=435908 RepID=UPI00068CB4D8|nr:diguanylate cyclase [Pseudidiomarina salinarum]RUO69105.1 GGDEF domain-containing protein [Pseudidiomarina salinarum]